jgi:hypothetical protein
MIKEAWSMLDPVIKKVIIYVLLVLVGLYLYKRYIKDVIKATVPEDTQTNGDTPTSTLTALQKEQVAKIASALHSDLEGWSMVFNRNAKPYQDMAQASNTMFVAIYNEFNKKYGKGSTIRQWLEEDVFYTDSDVGIAYHAILLRMDALNLI